MAETTTMDMVIAGSNQKQMVYTDQYKTDITLTPDIVRQFLVRGKSHLVTSAEITFFMHLCRARQLNPFLAECYLIKFSEKETAQIITAIQAIRDQAQTHPNYTGYECGVIVLREGKEDPVYSKGLVLKDDELVGAWFRAKPKGWEAAYALEINLRGYIKKKSGGEVTKFWQPEKQADMIRKVVESQGLRAIYGSKSAGLYVAEEMDQEAIELAKDEGGKFAAMDPEKIYGATKLEKPEKLPETTTGDRATTPEEMEEVIDGMSDLEKAETLHKIIGEEMPVPEGFESPEAFDKKFKPMKGPKLVAFEKAHRAWINSGAMGLQLFAKWAIKWKNTTGNDYGEDAPYHDADGAAEAQEEAPEAQEEEQTGAEELEGLHPDVKWFLEQCEKYREALGGEEIGKLLEMYQAGEPKDLEQGDWQSFLGACEKRLDDFGQE
jgi:phage recombination protein Bet